MSALTDRKALEALLIDHQRADIGYCLCGWGVGTGHLGRSHAEHVTEAILGNGWAREAREARIYRAKYRLLVRRIDALRSSCVAAGARYPDSLYIYAWVENELTSALANPDA